MNFKQIYFISFISFLLSIQVSSSGQTATQKKLELIRVQLENKITSVGYFDSTSLIATHSFNGRMGYIDTAGKEVKIKTGEKINSVYPFINGYALITTKVMDKKVFYTIDSDGRLLQKLNNIADIFDGNNIDGIIAIDNSGKYGVIDRKGKTIVPFKYYLLVSIGLKYLKAYVGERFNFKVGVIDLKDSIIIPAINDQLFYFNKDGNYLLICDGKDLVAVDKGRKYIVKDAFPKNYPESSRVIVDYTNGMILNRTHDIEILYDLKLDTIKAVTQKFDDIDFISHGLIGVTNLFNKEFDNIGRLVKATGAESSLVTKEGKIIRSFYTGDKLEFHDGLSRVKDVKENFGYVGFINENGDIVISCIYKKATDFRYGFAKVEIDNKYYLIDKKGNFVMEISPF